MSLPILWSLSEEFMWECQPVARTTLIKWGRSSCQNCFSGFQQCRPRFLLTWGSCEARLSQPLALFLCQQLMWQVQCAYHGLSCCLRTGGGEDKQSVMDANKKRKTITPVWRPVCTHAISKEGWLSSCTVKYPLSAIVIDLKGCLVLFLFPPFSN